MSEDFFILVIHKGKEVKFPAKLVVYGYSYRILVEVYGTEVMYEPDEEKNYRATIDPQQKVGSTLDKELLKAIAEVIEQRMYSC